MTWNPRPRRKPVSHGYSDRCLYDMATARWADVPEELRPIVAAIHSYADHINRGWIDSTVRGGAIWRACVALGQS